MINYVFFKENKFSGRYKDHVNMLLKFKLWLNIFEAEHDKSAYMLIGPHKYMYLYFASIYSPKIYNTNHMLKNYNYKFQWK